MIEIATKSKSLDLLEDSKITIKKKSSLFTILEKEDKQSHSYPFSLPLSPRNNSVLSNSLLEEKQSTISVSCKKNGVRLFKADLRKTDTTHENYEVVLQLNQKVDLFNRKLNSLYSQLGTFFITDSTRYVDLLFKIHPVILVPFYPSYNATVEVVVTGITYTVTDTLDLIMSTLATVINADIANNNANAIVTNTVELRIEEVNPSLPFFAYSQNWSTRFNGGSPYGSIGLIPLPKDQVANRELAETHVNAIDNLTDFRDSPYCFPFFLVEMETNNIFPFVIVNAFNSVTELYEAYQDAVFLPNFRITALIEKILSLEGWRLESVFFKDIEIEKLFLTNAYAIGYKNSGDWYIQQYLQFFWADCLPDCSFVELIEELKNRFCLNVEYDHIRKILKIEPANSIISNKLAKEYNCTPVFSQKEKEEADGYTLKYNLSENKDNPKEINTGFLTPKVIGNGKEEITSDFPFLPLYQALDDVPAFPFLEGGLKMPASFAAYGYVRGFDIFWINKAFWIKEGIIKSINFMDYVRKQSTFLTDNYSLLWETLYNQFYKNYLNLLDNSEVEREVIFTFSELQSLDLLKRIRLEYSNYYIKELEYTLTNSEQLLILAKVILIKTI